MPTVTIRPDLEFFYLDSGVPQGLDVYKTLVIIHGHTYHGATFESLFTPSHKQGLRVITINRRGYPLSSPFTASEIEAMNSSSPADLESFMRSHGVNLALAIDKVALECTLPEGRNLTIAGWSNGAIFALGVIACVNDLGDEGMGEEDDKMGLDIDARGRLRRWIKGTILWDPPSVCFGVPPPADTYVPLYDDSIPLEARGPAFGVWVASYFKHTSITSHSISDLSQKHALSHPSPSSTRMTPSQFVATTDLAGGGSWDTIIVSPKFMDVYTKMAQKALFDSRLGEIWGEGGFDVCVLVGDANPWPVIYGMWAIEGLVNNNRASGSNETYRDVSERVGRVSKGVKFGFKVMEGANHFVFWDNPNGTVDVLQACIAGDMKTVVIEPVSISTSA